MAKRRNRPIRNRYGSLFNAGASALKNIAYQRLSQQFRGGGSKSRLGQRGRYDESGGVSNQYQTRELYRKRRSGRRSRKFSRFARRVNRAAMAMDGCQQFVFSFTGTATSAQGSQSTYAFSFLGAGGGGLNNDIVDINTSLLSQGASASYRKNDTIYVMNQCLDMTIYANTANVTSDCDIYFLRCREDNTVSTSIDQAWNTQLTGQQKPDGTGATNLTIATMGVTPFQAPQFCRYWTILRKRKIIMTQGQVYHYQWRIKKPMRIMTERYSDSYYLRGTYAVLIVFNGITSTSGALTNFPASQLTFSFVRTYNVKHAYAQDDRAVKF